MLPIAEATNEPMPRESFVNKPKTPERPWEACCIPTKIVRDRPSPAPKPV